MENPQQINPTPNTPPKQPQMTYEEHLKVLQGKGQLPKSTTEEPSLSEELTRFDTLVSTYENLDDVMNEFEKLNLSKEGFNKALNTYWKSIKAKYSGPTRELKDEEKKYIGNLAQRGSIFAQEALMQWPDDEKLKQKKQAFQDLLKQLGVTIRELKSKK